MSPPAAKCFGRSSKEGPNSGERVGTEGADVCVSAIGVWCPPTDRCIRRSRARAVVRPRLSRGAAWCGEVRRPASTVLGSGRNPEPAGTSPLTPVAVTVLEVLRTAVERARLQPQALEMPDPPLVSRVLVRRAAVEHVVVVDE